MNVSIKAQRSLVIVTVIVITGVLLSFSGYYFTRNWENKKRVFEMEQAVNRYAAALSVSASQYELVLTAVRNFIYSSSLIDREEFHIFVTPFIKTFSGIDALGWAPIIEREHLRHFLYQAELEGYKDYKLTSDGAASVLDYDSREWFLPVYYTEPEGNPFLAPGYELNHDDKIALIVARSGFKPASFALTIQDRTGKKSLWVFMPVYDYGKTKDSYGKPVRSLRGFIIGVLNLNMIISSSFDSLGGNPLPLKVFDLDSPFHEQLVYPCSQAVSQPDAALPFDVISADGLNQAVAYLEISGRRWAVVGRSDVGTPIEDDAWQSWVVLSGGLLLTFILSFHLYTLMTHTVRIEETVRKKTAELEDANRILGQEVEERKRVEIELRDSRKQYKMLVENSPDLIVRFNEMIIPTYVSSSVAKTFDIHPEEAVGKTFSEMAFPDRQVQFLEERIRDVFLTGRPYEGEHAVDGVKGGGVLDWRLFPEFDEQGRIVSVLSISRDITELKKAEEDYRVLFTEMLDGFALHEIICDASGNAVDYRFLAVNPAFESLTGLKAFRVIGKTVKDVLPNTEEYWIETYGRVALTGKPVQFENYSAELDKFFEVRSFSPGIGYFATVFMDITGRKRAEEEKRKLEERLIQAQKMEAVGTLAGGIAHDFNNILAVIIGNVELALMDAESVAGLRPYLEQILKASDRAGKLVNQMLAFSKKIKSDNKPLDIGPLVRRTLEANRHLIQHGVEILTDISDDAGIVQADPEQVNQVVMNLCLNAAQAIGDNGGVIKARVYRELVKPSQALSEINLKPGPFAVISIEDDGPGIRREIRRRVFEPFFTTRGPSHPGMGLAVVHGVANSHGGTVLLESEEGKGTVVKVFLPIREDASTSKNRGSALRDKGEKKSVLLVDDEQSLVDVCTKILEKMGLRVVSRNDGLEALNLLNSDPDAFDLVITDQTMPKMSGLELASRIAEIRPDLPVILCSGYSGRITPDKMKGSGIKAFLMKPYSMKDLSTTVNRVLED